MTQVGISLDCLDNNFHMVVVDGDYIAPNDPVAPNPDQGSSNVVTCSARKGESLDEYFACSVAEIAPGVPGRYKINLNLKKSLTTIIGNEYEFIVVAQVL